MAYKFPKRFFRGAVAVEDLYENAAAFAEEGGRLNAHNLTDSTWWDTDADRIAYVANDVALRHTTLESPNNDVSPTRSDRQWEPKLLRTMTEGAGSYLLRATVNFDKGKDVEVAITVDGSVLNESRQDGVPRYMVGPGWLGPDYAGLDTLGFANDSTFAVTCQALVTVPAGTTIIGVSVNSKRGQEYAVRMCHLSIVGMFR